MVSCKEKASSRATHLGELGAGRSEALFGCFTLRPQEVGCLSLRAADCARTQIGECGNISKKNHGTCDGHVAPGLAHGSCMPQTSE